MSELSPRTRGDACRVGVCAKSPKGCKGPSPHPLCQFCCALVWPALCQIDAQGSIKDYWARRLISLSIHGPWTANYAGFNETTHLERRRDFRTLFSATIFFPPGHTGRERRRVSLSQI